MRFAKMAVVTTALVVAAGIGAAVAPVAHAQRARVARARAPQAVEVFTGGSRIGISVRDVDQADAKESKLPAVGGALVEDVSEDSPASKAGIRQGDVIVEFDGERVRSARQLTRLVQETPDGRQVQATVVRGGQRTTVTVEPQASGSFSFSNFGDFEDLGRTLRYTIPRAARPSTPPPSAWRFDDLLGRGGGRLGITVDELSSQLAEYFGTKDGVLVTSVSDNSAAAKAGVKAGDVITSVNGTAVNDPADVRRAIQDISDGGEFTLGVVRDKKPQTLKGQVERTERRSRRWTMVL
jgi:serine protease Do